MGWIYIKKTDSYRYSAQGGEDTPLKALRVSVGGETPSTTTNKKTLHRKGNTIQAALTSFRESRAQIQKSRIASMKEQTQGLKAERRLLKEQKSVMGLRSELEQMKSTKKEKRKAIDDLFGFG